MGEIVVYKLGDYMGQDSSSIVNEHIHHAKLRNGNVLFTVFTENNTKIGKNHDLSEIIVTTASGSPAFIGKLKGHNSYGVFKKNDSIPSDEHTSPSQFDIRKEIEKKYTWFKVSDLREISKDELEDYQNNNTEKSLLKSISGVSCRIYVEKK